MKLRLLAALSVCLLTGSSVKADQMIPLPIEELSQRAQMILRGKVISKTVQRDPETGIYTAVDLQVDEVWKGKLATNHFTVVYGGGVLGDEEVQIAGQVAFEIGEQVVAFLVLNARGEGICIGLSQGKFHLWNEAGTREQLAHNRFHGLRPSLTGPTSSLRLTSRPIVSRLTLADLKQRAAEGTK